MEKTCIISLLPLTWTLEVDGMTIGFTGSANAEYFEKHYESLGYKIIKKYDENMR